MKIPIKVKTKKETKEEPSISTQEKKFPKLGAGRVWENISKISIYFLVFLLPIFFLPWTPNVLDFNKQALLYFLVFISLGSWFFGVLAKGRIDLKSSALNWLVFLFLIILGVSTGFSSWRYGSFWGWPLNVSSSFLTILGLVLVYFLVVNIFKKTEIFRLFYVLIGSSFLVALFGIFQIFNKFIFPFGFSKITSFNTIGTVNSLGIFGAVLLPLIISLAFINRRPILLIISGLTILFLVFLVNSWAAWVSLLIGTAIVLVFVVISRGGIFQTNLLAPLMLVLIMAIALFFSFLKINVPGLPPTPMEVSPSQSATFDIAKRTLMESSSFAVLGSGPSTFVYDYSKFKPVVINQTAFWGTRFSRGSSEILDRLASTGILGLISFLAILVTFIWIGAKRLVKKVKKMKKESLVWALNLGVFASWLSMATAFFLYPTNLSLSFLFWIFTAGFIGMKDEDKIDSWELKPGSRAAVWLSLSLVFFSILGFSIFFFGGQRYIAEIRYLQGLRAVQKGDNQAGINYLSSAISHSGGKQDNYWRDLSQVYLFRINEELQKTDISKEEAARRVVALVRSAVNSTKRATDVAPQNVANWLVRGFVYRNVTNLIKGGADEWAIKSYERAAKLEPVNPYIYTEIGRVYFAKNELDKARERFNKAIDLKADYAPAHFQLAMISVKEGKTKEALQKLEQTKAIAPFDVGLAFQIGLLYYNDKQFDKAKAELERAVSLNKNYSNARYFLGLIYDKEGKKELAIEQFERIKKLNPDNKEVEKILANLRSDKSALEGITPAQPPIEEKPPERLKKK